MYSIPLDRQSVGCEPSQKKLHTSSGSNLISLVPEAKVQQTNLNEGFTHPDEDPKADDCSVVLRRSKASPTNAEEDYCESELAWWTDDSHSEVGWEHEDHVSND